jgi:hypothetical protein
MSDATFDVKREIEGTALLCGMRRISSPATRVFFEYSCYEREFFSEREAVCKVRLLEVDSGYEIIVLSCPFGYGADEANWIGINFGVIDTKEEAVAIPKIIEWIIERTGDK